MNKHTENIIPKHLTLSRADGRIRYKASGAKINPAFINLLKENKTSILRLMLEDNCNSIEMYPLAQNQKSLWFIHQLAPNSAAYNVGLAIKIFNTNDLPFLKVSLEKLIQRHWPLRSRILKLNDNKDFVLCQVATQNFTPTIKRDRTSFASETALKEKINADNNIAFDPENGPLFRTFTYKFDGYSYLLFSFHHMICDAISLQRFADEFASVYKALSNNDTVVSEPDANSYADFIFDQYEFLQSSDGKKQVAFWQEMLKNVRQTINLPTDFPRPKIHQFNGNSIHFRIDNTLYSSIKTSAQKHQVTPSTYLFTIYQILLAEFSKQQSFCIGIPVSARTNSRYSNLFGYLINTLPVPCVSSAEQSFAGVLKNNSHNILSILENQDLPFSVIVDKIATKRDLSKTPIFQVFYNYLNRKALGSLNNFLGFDEDKQEYAGHETTPVKLKDQEGQFDLTLELFDNDKHLNCSIKYNTDIFSSATAHLLINRFKELIHELSSDPDYKLRIEEKIKEKLPVNITGTFTSEPLKKGLEFWFDRLNLPAKINFAGFNQVYQQLLDPGSSFNAASNQINIVLLRVEDLFPNRNIVVEDTNATAHELLESITAHTQNAPSNKLVVLFCPPSDQWADNKNYELASKQIETAVLNASQSQSNLITVSSDEILRSYGLSNYYEALGEEQGNIPYRNNFFACAATLIARKINAIYTPPFKAIALDCDNTLWQGIVGEDGVDSIIIGEAEKKLQQFLIEQHHAGVLLCLCSKNNESDVWEVFENNEHMLLKREHILFSRINWNPKSENIVSLAREINIGVDSFVLIDDNPAECEQVRSHLPSVLTIQKRNDTDDINYILNSWVFDKNRITEEDKKRALMYEKEAARIQLKSELKTYKEFIDDLQIKLQINPVGSDEIPRVSQLTFRTNQFNFTTIRRSEEEIKSLINTPKYLVHFVHLEDKFGDYGIIGVLIASEQDDVIFVDTFLLSCRALAKGVEHAMIAHLGKIAQDRNKKQVRIAFSETKKNSVAQKFMDANFAACKTADADEIYYNIPTTLAVAFHFDPGTIQSQNEDPDAQQSVEIPQNILSRNKLFSDIVDHFTDLDSIMHSIYGENYSSSQNIKSKTELNSSQIEAELLEIWRETLNNPDVQPNDNFFDAGGDSILIPSMVIRLKKGLGISISIVDVFQYPTVATLAAFVSAHTEGQATQNTPTVSVKAAATSSNKNTNDSGSDIAIIGLAGRFPGADSIDEFWQILKNGEEAITHYSREELEKKGVAKQLLDDPNYVYAVGSIPSADKFDASFFGFTPKEADFMDPQHRIFLETCHEALEVAGYSSEKYEGSIGVFAGSGPDNYILKNLFQHGKDLRNIGEFQTIINNGKDFLTTHVSYRLNLNGPSLNIQTACSTSLVATHYACNSLISNQSDIALAGGAFVHTPREIGYMYEPGGILSPKGQCRPFDKDADGTVFGEGVGVVVLKRYEDALKDNDTIWAVIKGSAVNNDGAEKVGYMAPGVAGQSKVVSMAQQRAGVNPSEISYIETHGTGTNLGDPIEVKALTKVFRTETQEQNFCAIGSIKANIGHLDAAAGIASIIKTTLALKNRKIPPSINFATPNPELNLPESPFYVSTELEDWKPTDKPRTAGISSFGIGGTNAHCILQEVTENTATPSKQSYHLIPVSAKTESALNNIKKNLVNFLIKNECLLPDLAFTLQQGRKRFKYRSALLCDSSSNIIENLIDTPVKTARFKNPRIAYLFTGQGSQYSKMAEGLYHKFPVFRKCMDEAFSISKSKFGLNLEQIIFSDDYKTKINNTEYAQPALFAIQYSTAKLLSAFNISPNVLIGHSIGEITAACISGLFSFEDGLKLVITRGRLMQAQRPGSMLSIQLPAAEVKKILPAELDFALQNAPNFSVVSGETEDIDRFQKQLESDFPEIMITRLKTSHAFHSRMMEPALEEFRKSIADITFNTIDIPFVSNTTGTWVEQEVVGNVDYWVNHIRASVNFVDGINTLLEDKNTLFIEVGPGMMLTTLLSQFETEKQKITSIPTIRHPRKKTDDVEFFLNAVSSLWSYGADNLFDSWYAGEKRKRIPLPTYPFERKRHWIDPVVPFSYHFENKNDVIAEKRTADKMEQSAEKETLHQRPELSTSYDAPSNAVEEKLIAIWQELLGIESIGVNDDFFELGGHSLLASKLLVRIKNEFGTTIRLQDLNEDATSVRYIGKLLSGNPEVQHQSNSKFKIVVKKTNEITEDEWDIYVEQFNGVFRSNFSKNEFLIKYTQTPLGFSFHSFIYFNNEFVGSQSFIVELLRYKNQIIKVACGVDLFLDEKHRKSFTLIDQLWKSADTILQAYNVKAHIGNPLPALLAYNEAAQTGFQLISQLSTYVLPLTFKAVHKKLGFLDFIYHPILLAVLSARSKNKSPIHKTEKLFKAHQYYSPYDYKTTQEELGNLKFSWLWRNKNKHLKIINDNFETKGDIYTASKHLASEYINKAEAIVYITTNKLSLPFKLFHKREMFIGKILSEEIDSNDFYNINNWEFRRGFFD